MQYQLTANFADGRPSVVSQAKDAQSAFDTYAAMSHVPGVRAVTMVGVKEQYLGQGAAALQQPPPPSQPEYRPVSAAMRQYEPVSAQQQQQELEQQQQPPPQRDEHPQWAKMMMTAAAALGPTQPSAPIAAQPEIYQQQYQQQQQLQQPVRPAAVAATRTKTPLDEYMAPLQLGASTIETKRFKRSADTPGDFRRPAPPTPLPTPPQPQPQPARQTETSSTFLMQDNAGGGGGIYQGYQRPFSKDDADLLGNAKFVMESSLSAKTHAPNRSPRELASILMQKHLPSLANVDWSQQPAYRDDYSRLLDTCQRILTGQPVAVPEAKPQEEEDRPEK
jgi:hypothetical protein